MAFGISNSQNFIVVKMSDETKEPGGDFEGQQKQEPKRPVTSDDLSPNSNTNKPLARKPQIPKFNFYWIYGIIAIILLVTLMVPGENAVSTSWTKVQREMLPNKDVKKIIIDREHGRVYVVINKDLVRVKEPYSKDLKSLNPDMPAGHYFFYVSDLESFNRQLEESLKQNDPEKQVEVTTDPNRGDWTDFFKNGNLIILIMIVIFSVVMFRKMSGGGAGGGPGSQIFNIGKSRATLFDKDTKVNINFSDVAGLEEAKQEVMEIVDFLKNPKKYTNLGGKIPKGALLIGPPGTGKTLLAKAVAGEASVPFFSLSGSDFVEMFVGVGASRVRDLFRQAKEKAPCIIFIDEIDAIGRARGKNLVQGGNDERENTLNQLLTEMDGFGTDSGVIILAATNRPDILDTALLRPGRFDRQIGVDRPDLSGREQIFKVHLKSLKLDNTIDPHKLALQTPGFVGADIANICNEAALFAARGNKKEVTMNDLEKAKDKILMGAEKRTMVMSEDDKLLTAYHEAGHCIVGQMSPDHDPVYKVSIMPRGRALGITMFLPEQDQYSASKRKLESQIASLFGGRIAELMIYGGDRVTTGASNDIERATELARNMVTRWGFSDKLGPLVYGEQNGQPFMGHQGSPGSKVSGNVAQQIDEEIRAVIDLNYNRAETILEENISILHKMADALMKWETIDKDQIDALMAGKDPKPPKDDNDFYTKPNLYKQDKVDIKPITSSINKGKPAGQV